MTVSLEILLICQLKSRYQLIYQFKSNLSDFHIFCVGNFSSFVRNFKIGNTSKLSLKNAPYFDMWM